MRVGSPAFSDFFEHLQPQLLRFFLRRVGNAEEARDLCQETWLRITEQATSSWSSDEQARAYVFTVADHLLIDMARRRGVESNAMRDMGIRSQGKNDTDVAEGLSYRQALHAVDDVLHTLPERKRDAFIRHRLHGERQDGIAATLGVSINTVERDIMQVDSLLEDALHRWRGTTPAASVYAAANGSAALSAKGSRRRRSLSALLGLVVFAGTGIPSWYLWRQRVQWQDTITSQIGNMLNRTLPDGSQIQLDADSRVAITYRAHMRHALLQQGAAFFSVQTDSERPFVVEADSLQVRVVGTQFSVGLEPQAIVVEVEEGVVQVVPTGDSSGEVKQTAVTLQAGERLRVPRNASIAQTWQVEKNTATATWRHGDLIFDRERLANVAARLQRYSTHRIDIDSQVQALQVSGRMRVRDARNWLTGLSQVLPVQVSDQADGSIRVHARHQ
ncbi:sigma-70 family RNA polymerase sigma factor [Lampropedia puyangensis]|uniref:Sigma-70 family RNA polymerase sigma factor n=1 Tax=Lampropedia puyangensis TaxID=1330072 RepID=A0A4S8FEG0_9BURK|nr:sigma-70 family RNA polymerase sigma factor [Lampropedia puyangensis]THU05074.1 sigma-70 family RNA polymerase sigma factor [Lampropedia puyangensis]